MIEQISLPNGVQIMAEPIDHVRSCAIGIWVGTGSRHEKAQESGAAHFIEHMVFKGTPSRSAEDIARETDAIGGQINAFTTKECTCFYARVLDSHVEQTLDILWDMVYHSSFRQEDVETERSVILEEIGMYQDTPDDLCAERLFAAVYKGSSLARPILGKGTTLAKLTGEALRDYQKKHYKPENTVVSLAGSYPDSILRDLRERFGGLSAGRAPGYRPASYQNAVTLKRKATEQNHLTLAFPGLTYQSPRRFALQLLSSILGGGMSSRLFQEVREKQGLCYSVYTYGAGHEDTGIFNVYTALSRDTEGRALETIRREIEKFVHEGPTEEELSRACEQSKANVLMGLESTQARMSHMARSLLFTGEVMTTQDIIYAYDAVTRQQIQELAAEIFRFDTASISVVGKVFPKETYEEFLMGKKAR